MKVLLGLAIAFVLIVLILGVRSNSVQFAQDHPWLNLALLSGTLGVLGTTQADVDEAAKETVKK